VNQNSRESICHFSKDLKSSIKDNLTKYFSYIKNSQYDQLISEGEHIYTKYLNHLEKFKQYPVRYLLIGDSPDTISNYFFSKPSAKSQKPGFGRASPIDCFEGGEDIENNFNKYMEFLRKNGFLVIDVIYLPSGKLKKKKYNKKSYPNLIRTFLPLNISILKTLQWERDLRIKVAYPVTCRMLCVLLHDNNVKMQFQGLSPILNKKLFQLKPTDYIANFKYAVRLEYNKLISNKNPDKIQSK
jgi:hypothetical protein